MKARTIGFSTVVVVLASLLPAYACTPQSKSPVVDAGDGSDADVSSVVSSTCTSYCANAAKLGCIEAQPTPAGASCTDVCAQVQAGAAVRWNLSCRTKATTCATLDACERN